MVVRTRKKSRRMHGNRLHGYGKQHRGKGSRGGVGRAGRGKQSAHRKPSYREPFGKHGFHPAQPTQVRILSLKDVEDKLRTWLNEGKAKEAAGAYEINLTELGYDKLLGTGQARHKLKLKIPQATKAATEKITAAGGEITQ